MKIEELEQERQAKEQDPDQEEFEESPEEEGDNLNEALALLDDCHALLKALVDPTLHRRINPYMHRELLRVGQEVENLLTQYDLPTDEEEIV